MKHSLFIGTLFFFFTACNEKIYPLYKQNNNTNKPKIDSSLMYYSYSYRELANSEPHSQQYWMHEKDTSKYYDNFYRAIRNYFTANSISMPYPIRITNIDIDNFINLASRNSFDSLINIAKQKDKIPKNANFTWVLKVDFVLNKGSGTSGLGPMGNYYPWGTYYAYCLIFDGEKPVFFNSVKRTPSIFNPWFTKGRSLRVVRKLLKPLL